MSLKELTHEDIMFITGGDIIAGGSRTAWKLCEKYKTSQDYLWARISDEEREILWNIESNVISDSEAMKHVYM